MAGQDGYVAVQPDGAGKKLDTTEFTRPDGTLIERQRIDVVANVNDTAIRRAAEAETLSLADALTQSLVTRGRERFSTPSLNRGQR